MKKVILTLGVLALTGGLCGAQDVNELVPAPAYEATAQAPERSALDKAVIANERKVGDALMKKDKAAFSSLVSADGWGIDANGMMKNSEMAASLDQLVLKNYTISDEKVTWVDANTAILAYKWTGSGTVAGQPLPSTVYASTVWTKKGDKWVAVFHQETEAAKK
ncbi:MAG: nuclear transport factor 2 family protein [Vicinamibacterales bacterium]